MKQRTDDQGEGYWQQFTEYCLLRPTTYRGCVFIFVAHTICFSVACQERYVPAKIKFILPRKVRRSSPFWPVPAPFRHLRRLHPVQRCWVWRAVDIQHGRSLPVGWHRYSHSYNTRSSNPTAENSSAAVSASGTSGRIWLQISPLSRGVLVRLLCFQNWPLPLLLSHSPNHQIALDAVESVQSLQSRDGIPAGFNQAPLSLLQIVPIGFTLQVVILFSIYLL